MTGGGLEPAALSRRIERASALQLERFRAARGCGAPALEVAGGLAISHGVRSPFSVAVGVGIGAPVTPEDLDRIEAHLGPGGGPVRVEVTPFADASLAEELGRRGYHLERFFLVWTREPAGASPPGADPAHVRRAAPDEAPTWLDVFARSYLGAPGWSRAQREAFLAMPRADGTVAWLADDAGEAAGVALSSAEGGVAWLSGAGVLPSHRGRGLQRSLVQARLDWAAALGCDVAASATEPGTASQRTLERCGFRAAYPKAVLVH